MEVPNPQYTGLDNDHAETIPKAFKVVSGTVNSLKLKLANKMLVDWQLNVEKKRIKESDPFPYYQPSTQSMHLRTFFHYMSVFHGWEFGASHFTNFEGCLNGVINTIYEQRFQKYVSVILFYFQLIVFMLNHFILLIYLLIFCIILIVYYFNRDILVMLKKMLIAK